MRGAGRNKPRAFAHGMWFQYWSVMQKNDLIEIDITDMGDSGGIGKADGMAFFVKDAIIGDRIQARVTKLKKNYGYARLERIIAPSEARREPPCPLHSRCGGCQIQAMAYPAQLRFKQNKVRSNLIRLGGFDPGLIDEIMEPIVGMEDPFRYRNKAQYPIGMDSAKNPVAGFYAARTHSIIPARDCLLEPGADRAILDAVLKYMREYRVKAYDEESKKGIMRHVLIRHGFATGEIMAVLVINGRDVPHSKNLATALSRIPGMKSVSVNINTADTNVILGDRTECIWGTPFITDELRMLRADDGFSPVPGEPPLVFEISPSSFYQVNPVQTEKLYSIALEYAGLTGSENVWDVYCGIGTISLFLARRAKSVTGVESLPAAVEDAKRNAEINGIGNAGFIAGRAEDVLCQDMARPDVIVVDPPRKGCDEACIDAMLKNSPERIVYVSCDPATLARDLRKFCDGGYELKRIRAVDQFPHTVHVEAVVLLARKRL